MGRAGAGEAERRVAVGSAVLFLLLNFNFVVSAAAGGRLLRDERHGRVESDGRPAVSRGGNDALRHAVGVCHS